MLISIFGIDGGALSLVVSLLVLFLVVVYLALIWWTYLDAKRRIEDPVLIACATAASVFPFLGTVVYTILRPPEFIEDRAERELELRAAELRLRQLIEQSCSHCEYPIESNYLRCPNCERRIRNPCRKCSKPIDPSWGTCPYCETEVRRPSDSAGPRERDRDKPRDRESSRERDGQGKRESRAERAARRERAAERTARAAERSARTNATPERASRSERPERAPRSERAPRPDGKPSRSKRSFDPSEPGGGTRPERPGDGVSRTTR